uniref:Uncharacterized protein n=1 Tax=viral metagenome TaxID=1070528 RepID=A0A6C0IEK6_9ZZZZ
MFHYFILGILFSRLFITESSKQYEYLCKPHQRKILTSTIPLCLYNCNKGFVRLRIDGYDIDKNVITMKEAVSYYYNLLNQDTIYISVNNTVTSLLDRPAFGYLVVTNGTETNLFVPFEKKVEYKVIKSLIKTRKMLDLYYPACVHSMNTEIPITFKKENNYFNNRYILMYDTIHNITKLFATLSNKVEKVNLNKTYI